MNQPVKQLDAARNQELYIELVKFGQNEQVRRRESPVHVKRDVQFGKPGLRYMVDPRIGFNNRTHRLWVNQLPPGGQEGQAWKTLGHRHTVEAVIYWLSGYGYSIIDGQRYDWKAGDVVCVPMFAWHRHVNDSDQYMDYVASTTGPLSMGLGQAVYEDELYPQFWVYAQQGEDAAKALTPGGTADLGKLQRTGAVTEAQRLYSEEVSFAYHEEIARRKSRVICRSREMKFESTNMGRMAYVVDARNGFNVKALATVIAEVDPGKHTGSHRHLYDEIDFVLSGRGKAIIDDKTYEVDAGDALAIPVFAWHQYFATGDEPLRLLCHSTRPAMENLGLVLTQHGEDANYT